jgi:hypothetical protein
MLSKSIAMRPLVLLFALLFTAVYDIHAQLKCRLLAEVDSTVSRMDSTTYTYSFGRGRDITKSNYLGDTIVSTVDCYDSIKVYTEDVSKPLALIGQGKITYNSANKPVVSVTSYSWGTYTDSNWYDKYYNLVKSVNHSTNGPQGKNYCDYNNGLLIKGVRENYTGSKYLERYIWEYGYDNNNNLVSEIRSRHDSLEVLTDSTRTDYLFSGSQINGSFSQKFVGGQMVNSGKVDLTYNSNNLVTLKVEYVWFNGQWYVANTDTSTYDSNSDRVVRAGMDYYTGDGGRSTMVYDSNHNNIYTLSEASWGGPLFNISLDSSKYDQYNNLVYHWRYTRDFNTGGWTKGIDTWFTHNYYEYYQANSVQKETNRIAELTLFPNPASSVLQLKIVTKGNQHCTFVVSDIQGRVLRQWADDINGSEHESLPISNFPNGEYIISVKVASDIKSQKFSVSN